MIYNISTLQKILGNWFVAFEQSLNAHVSICHGGASSEQFVKARKKNLFSLPEKFQVTLTDNSIHYYDSDGELILSMNWDDEGFTNIYSFWKALEYFSESK